jgi:hypothetical protein
MRGAFLAPSAAGVIAGLMSVQAIAQSIEFPATQWEKLNPAYTGNQADLVTSFNRRSPNFELIVNFSKRNRYRKLSEPVGRIEILMQKPDGRRGVSFCTGTLISPRYILTNNHCIPGKKFKVLRAQIRFGYLTRQSRGRVFPLAIQPVETNPNLDYSIVRVGGNPAAIFGHIKIRAKAAQAGEELFIIHHPLGQPKRLTRKDCRASPQRHFRKQVLRHRCDTEGGSSGSLIFSDISLNLVGLHFAGGLNPNNPNSSNHAIRISLLVQHSPILRALSKGKTVAARGPKPGGGSLPRSTMPGTTPGGAPGTPPGTTPGLRPGPAPTPAPSAPGTGALNNRPVDMRIARFLIGDWRGRMNNGRLMSMRFRASGTFALADLTRRVAVGGRWRVSRGRVLLRATKVCTSKGCRNMPQPGNSWFRFRAVGANTMQTKNGVYQRKRVASTF